MLYLYILLAVFAGIALTLIFQSARVAVLNRKFARRMEKDELDELRASQHIVRRADIPIMPILLVGIFVGTALAAKARL